MNFYETGRYHCRIRSFSQRPRLAAGPGQSAGGRTGRRGHELRADPARRAAPAAGGRPRPRSAHLRGRLRLRPARPLRRGRGRSLCPRGGAAPFRRRVRRTSLRGRDAGRRPPDAGSPRPAVRRLPRCPQDPAVRWSQKLCCRAAGCGGSALPRHSAGRPAGQAQQQPGRGILQGHP